MLTLSTTVKSAVLTNSFNKAGNTYYLSIPNIIGTPAGQTLPNQIVTFTITGDKATLSTPVQFAVQAGTQLDRLWISTAPLNESSPSINSDLITLSPEESELFSTNGIYLINLLRITLTERDV